MRLFVGFLVAAFIGVVGLVGWTFMSAKWRNGAAAMPAAQVALTPASFAMESATQFHVRKLKSFEYQPSETTQKTVRAGKTWDGIVPVTWHYIGPQIARPVPLIIAFHEQERTGLSMIEMWLETARAHNLAVLAPTAPNGSWPIESPSPQGVEKMIETLALSHEIDRDQVYLFGHSAGAAYAQALLNKSKGPWKAAALHGGFLPAAFQIVPEEPKPYRAYVGEHEAGFALEDIRVSGEAMAARGMPNELIVIPQHTHWFYDIGPQITDDAWAWFSDLP